VIGQKKAKNGTTRSQNKNNEKGQDKPAVMEHLAKKKAPK
jgi:hypothetical protein